MSEPGLVVAGHGRDCLVRTAGGLVTAKARRRGLQPVAGDRVVLEGGILESIEPRASAFSRASAHRTKVIAANVTQVAIVVACDPPFSDELPSRMLVAAEVAGLGALLVLNKVDLEAGLADARARLAPFQAAGYPVVELSAARDASPLRARLAGQRTVLTGQSGMGKSTLLKALVPDADVRIGEISRFLSAGRQTTTTARLYALDADSDVIDTPGVAEFGLAGLDDRAIAAGFREFAEYAAGCRFHDCLHLAEPGCAVRAAGVSPRRLELYARILAEERAARRSAPR